MADDNIENETAAELSSSSLTIKERFTRTKTALTTKSGLVGEYDYGTLCLPRIPCLPPSRRAANAGIFFGLDDCLPVAIGMLMGFQHMLAMIGGIITVPRILAGAGSGHLNLEPDVQAYLISSALIVSGLMSLIQIIRFRLIKGYYVGTGLLSMSGTSFTFLPIAEAIFRSLQDDGFCPADEPCPDAYGRWLGTILVGCFLEIFLSFLRPRMIKKLFPPLVTGTTVFLIGASLVGVGLKYWAGGSGPCIDAATEFFAECPNISAERSYPWGDAHWIGLGFFVFSIILLVEIFGSPFMRNTQIMIGLIAGIILSAALGYLQKDLIDAAPWITFIWVRTFKLGFYAPGLIPVLLGFAVSSIETVGDITATCEVSRVETEGPKFESRIQGGLLADGINSFIAALMTSNPTTTFSQNNGVIAMTRTANRVAGIWAAGWLILFGIVGKIGGVFVAIPDSVLGGMTTFLFANVAVSGIRILAGLRWTRRDRFILAFAISLGLGVVIVPNAFDTFIPTSDNETLQSLRQGVIIVLSTGYSIAALIAMVLNLVLPHEEEALSSDQLRAEQQARKMKSRKLDDEENPDTPETGITDDSPTQALSPPFSNNV
eukprot:Plantae.Rhodophyta-Hildenbrandia_rubra.ctg21673.p1 GENE.Plantae.Rhodophyta-Hildenbrandia_rubra.ctg21673~~Plantae.Rhodophyta-Hildenbrandia_rubra.ctg21673.p1  ORF type:complete len:602 (-),score=56.37 Plantae.Rhodophyta-Hildenbrandia_rubra.ctg21673:1707-3512(-)